MSRGSAPPAEADAILGLADVALGLHVLLLLAAAMPLCLLAAWLGWRLGRRPR